MFKEFFLKAYSVVVFCILLEWFFTGGLTLFFVISMMVFPLIALLIEVILTKLKKVKK